MKNGKCLILYCDTGGGFKSPSIAVKKEFEKRGYEVTLLDFAHDLKSKFTDRLIKGTWRLCLRIPLIFKVFLFLADQRLLIKLLPKLMFITRKKIYDLIKKENYDIIFSTHFASTQLIADIKSKYKLKIPTFAYDADVFNSQYVWFNNNLDKIFVPTKMAYDGMLERNAEENKLQLVGFPLDDKFLKSKGRSALGKKLNLPDKFTILLMAGGEGIGKLDDYVDVLLNLNEDIHIIVICGKNKKIYNKLDELSKKHSNLSIFGFVDNMHEFYQCSDVVVGKGGFNFLFESIYLEKPMIINSYMANEEIGVRYVIDNNFAWLVKGTKEFSDLIKKILNDKSIIESAKERMAKAKFNPGTEEMVDYMIDFSNFKKSRKHSG